MYRLQCRGTIAGAAVLVVLLSSRPAAAQVGVDPGPPRERRGLCRDIITGVEYDVVNQALAEHRLQKLQAKVRRDAERGDRAALDHDNCRINKLRYRIVIDEWLIRWNSLEYPDFYPIRTDSVSLAAIAQATSPTQVPNPQQLTTSPGSMAGAPILAITIVNAESAGAGVDFAVDGVAYHASAGSRQDLAVAPTATITYDGGGSLGQRRYRISPGRYEFRSTPEGWVLYKLAGTP